MSHHEPALNIPRSILLVLVILAAIHIARDLISASLNNEMLFALAFIPARYTGVFPESTWGDVISVTSWVTYMFIHNDWTHLLMNSAGVLMFGSAVAMRIGGINFFLFSGICGIFGAAVHLIFYWGDLAPVIGASAAVSGHIAGAIRFIYGAIHNNQLTEMRHRPQAVKILKISEFFTDKRLIFFVLLWVGVNYVFAAIGYGTDETSTVAWEAHLGGFFAGLFLFGFFDPTKADDDDFKVVDANENKQLFD